MANRNPAPDWPLEATRLPQPGIGTALAATGMHSLGFGAISSLLAWRVQQLGGIVAAWANEISALIGVGVFSLGAALALVAFFGLAVAAWRNGPVWHAAASVLPDISSEPVDGREYPFGYVQPGAYVLKPVAGGWWFGSKAQHRYGGVCWFGVTFVAAVILLAIWRYMDDPREIKMILSCTVVFGWALVCMILWYVPKITKPFPFAAIDLSSGVCKLGPEPATSVRLDRIVAVQLCACRRRRRDSNTDGVELNLVWQPESQDGESEIEKYRRMTLMFIVGPYVCRSARLAGELADKLGVPLVCCATAEHWRNERRAAKFRQPAKIKWPTFGRV